MIFDIKKLQTEDVELVTDIHIDFMGRFCAKINGIVVATHDYGLIKEKIEEVYNV